MRGERASVLDIHVVSVVLYRSLYALLLLYANYLILFLCGSIPSTTGHLVSNGIDYDRRPCFRSRKSLLGTRLARTLDLDLSFRGLTAPVAMVVDPATF